RPGLSSALRRPGPRVLDAQPKRGNRIRHVGLQRPLPRGRIARLAPWLPRPPHRGRMARTATRTHAQHLARTAPSWATPHDAAFAGCRYAGPLRTDQPLAVDRRDGDRSVP